MNYTQLKDAAKEQRGISQSTFKRLLKQADDIKLIEKIGDKYYKKIGETKAMA